MSDLKQIQNAETNAEVLTEKIEEPQINTIIKDHDFEEVDKPTTGITRKAEVFNELAGNASDELVSKNKVASIDKEINGKYYVNIIGGNETVSFYVK